MTTSRQHGPPPDATRQALQAHLDQVACDVFTVRRGNNLTDQQAAAFAVARSNITAAGVLRAAADRGLTEHELYAWADDIQHAGEVAAQLGF